MIGAVYCNSAEIYRDADDEHKTILYALKAEVCLKDTDAFKLLVRVYIILSKIYMYQDNPQMSLSMDEAAWQIVKRHCIRGATRINVLNSLSATHYLLGNVQKSIHLLSECVSLTEEAPEEDLIGRAMLMLNLAAYHLDFGEIPYWISQAVPTKRFIMRKAPARTRSINRLMQTQMATKAASPMFG